MSSDLAAWKARAEEAERRLETVVTEVDLALSRCYPNWEDYWDRSEDGPTIDELMANDRIEELRLIRFYARPEDEDD